MSAYSYRVAPSIDCLQGNGPRGPRPVQQDHELQPKELQMAQQRQIRPIVSAKSLSLQHNRHPAQTDHCAPQAYPGKCVASETQKQRNSTSHLSFDTISLNGVLENLHLLPSLSNFGPIS